MVKYNINNILYGGVIFSLFFLAFVLIYSRVFFPIVDTYRCSNSNMYIDNSEKGGKFGRGVFANKNFKKGEVLEVAPILAGNDEEMFVGLYKNYVWERDGIITLLLGYASICNHSLNNNSDVIFEDDFYKLVAIKDIRKGEEILDTYCRDKTKEECNKWFLDRGIQVVD